jgi:hypothetical protein
VHRGTATTRVSTALYGLHACRLRVYFHHALRFLPLKMMACLHLGCTRQVGFAAIFERFSGFEFSLLPSIVHTRPSAGNANRWGAYSTMKHNPLTMTWVVLVALGFLASACGESAVTSREPPTATPSQESLTIVTPTVLWEPSPTPSEMNFYGYTYEPGAEPRLPPEPSVSMPIWGMALPVRPIESEPRFISSQSPAPISNPIALLEEAGCHVERGSDAMCEPDSPLATFGCEFIRPPAGNYPELGADRAIVGRCYSIPAAEDQPRDAYLFRSGCAFRRNVAHIIKVKDHYVLLDTADSQRAFFSPIESREEALSFAQMMTGLVAQFTFENDTNLLYFQDLIEGTRVTEMNSGYRMNLFHLVSCSCEPWINSEVEIIVNRSGDVIWLGAIPISMTTGFSCAD